MLPHEITALRESMRLNRSEFAALIGVSPRTLRRWEAGHSSPGRVDLREQLMELISERRARTIRRAFIDGAQAAKRYPDIDAVELFTLSGWAETT